MVVKAQPTWLWLELFPFNGNKLKQFFGRIGNDAPALLYTRLYSLFMGSPIVKSF